MTYKADEYGYVADVKYEGEAKYPEQYANAYSSYDPEPYYLIEPSYQPEYPPAYKSKSSY